MPAVAPIVAALAGAGAAASGVFAAGSIAAGVFGAVVTFGINTLAASLFKKDAPQGAAPQDFDQGLREVVRLSSESHKIIYGRARVGGLLAYIETAPSGKDSDGISKSGDNLFLHMIICHAGHEIDGYEEIYLNDTLVTLDENGFVQEEPYKKNGKSYVRIRQHLGLDSQLADTLAVQEAPNWTTAHRLRGIAYTYMRMQWNPDVFTNGIPKLNVVLRGKKVYDPRSLLTVWSDNAALCIRDYLTARDVINEPYGFGATADEIEDDFTIAAANISDEEITKRDGDTIARYTCNGIVDTEAKPLANLEKLVGSLAGAITCPAGTFRIHAGAYDTPDPIVIDESWLAGPVKSRNRIPRQELYNAVRGTYTEPSKSWQSDSFVPITSLAYEEQDNNERIYTDIELPYVIDGEVAQRIAKIMLRKGREQISASMPCNYRALRFTVWDTVKVNNATRGWVEKVFRITSMSFEFNEGVVLQLREENPESYDWLSTDAEAIAAAPDTQLPNPFVVGVPTSVAFNTRTTETVGGDVLYNLVLTWAPYTNAFVNDGGQFEIRFKLSSEANWRPSFYVSGEFTTADIISSSVNTSYDLGIRAVNNLGARSNWVTINNAFIGTSGGVGSTEDWDDFVTTATLFDDWGDYTSSPSSTDDWGTFN